ncbi:MAG: hypothetical protein H6721_00750 [Sandaracinus sp.]|nr:hypothetical protein [Sandaracinus sp.]MCB9616283.1 hypothetical protein [Sandaracinus sp.]MCB9630673.1 hypothetical protein [Sandaracinus sp.]
MTSAWSLLPSATRAFEVLRRAPLRLVAITSLWLFARGSGLFVVASFVPAAHAAPRPELPGDVFASQPPEVQSALRFVCGSVMLVALWTLAAWADTGFLRAIRDATREPSTASPRVFLRPGAAFGRMLAYHVASGLLVFVVCLVAVLPGAVVASIPDDPSDALATWGTVLALVPMAAAYVVVHARLLLAPHAVVLEERVVKDAWRSSFERTRGGSWRLLSFVAVLELVEAVSTLGLVVHWFVGFVAVTLAHAWTALVVMDRWGAMAPGAR